MDSSDNFGLNPILMLNRGLEESRGLVYFDTDKIESIVSDGYDTGKLTHTLVMHNCGSIDGRKFHDMVPSHDVNGVKRRATSFDIIALRLPKEWDRGIGFDSSSDIWLSGYSAVSTKGCNWYQAKTGLSWDYEGVYSHRRVEIVPVDQEKGPLDDFDDIVDPDKLYSEEEELVTPKTSIAEEYDKYLNGEDSLVVAACHFEYGNETLRLDLTDYVRSVISKKARNYGLLICFAPSDEQIDDGMTEYVGFFTDKTNTFFEPYLESRYDDSVCDSSRGLVPGRDNRLYLFFNVGGVPKDLDEMPSCMIDGNTYEVTRQFRGTYYASINVRHGVYEDNQILYAEWSNLKYDGEPMEDYEQSVIVCAENPFRAPVTGRGVSDGKYVTLSGINVSERVSQGELRNVEVIVKKPYDRTEVVPSHNIRYRLYVKNGDKEIDVIEGDRVNILPESSYFTVYTSELLPCKYYVDILMDGRSYKDVLHFDVVSNCTDQRY